MAVSASGPSATPGGDSLSQRALVEAGEAHLVSGRLITRLCKESAPTGATLVALGVRPHRRLSALTFGGHDVEALHGAPCSVLIARLGWGPSKPRRTVVGIDGSADGRAAELAARSLAGRSGCELVPVVGLDNDDLDLGLLKTVREDALLDPQDIAHAVVSVPTDDTLVLIGRRRARNHRWGGSIAERTVYSAHCSVLVVRHRARDAGARER